MESNHDLYVGIREYIEKNYPSIYIVDIKLINTKERKLQVYIDKDEGITLNECSIVSNNLSEYLDAIDFSDDRSYSLEVSSPGVGDFIKIDKQYKKNIGRLLSVVLKDSTVYEGKLNNVTSEGIVLAISSKSKQKPTVVMKEILFDRISKAVVKVSFK